MTTCRPGIRGFTLIEILVALTLGLLLSIGILSLFSNTSRTNKLQNGLARLQENGRFAVTRMESDLRMTAGQYCSNTGGSGVAGAVPLIPVRAPLALADNLAWPDPSPDASGGALTTMASVDTAGYPSATPALSSYLLSPRYFVQGYSCAAAGSCIPAGVPAGLPSEGTDAGDRVPGSDLLTIRYLRSGGWPYSPGGLDASGTCKTAATLNLLTMPGDETPDFDPGAQLALVTDCVNASIVPVTGFSGNKLTLGNVLTGAAAGMCSNSGSRDMRVFNFSKDFVTVTYYLVLREDKSPDARPNSPTAATRMIPVLMRRENGIDTELVQGVDQLAFRYGVVDSTGRTNFLTAEEVESGALPCPAPPEGIVSEPGCLWRAVRTIEAHLLVNSVDEVFGLDAASREYRFLDHMHPTTDTTTLPSTLSAGSMLRREFIAHVTTRNYNF